MDLQAIIEIDLHNMSTEEARNRIDAALKKAGSGVYRIRCIHGYHRGIRIKTMILEEYRYESKVIRIENGSNEGITELVLRN